MTYTQWQEMCATGLAPLQRSLITEEARDRLNRTWQPDIIIGLLQTEAYARAILSACIAVLDLPNDLEETVSARMERQRLLDEDGRSFRFLIGEAALWRTVGTPAVMAEQLERLHDATANPRVSLGIVPLAAEYRAPANGFVIQDSRVVSTETVGGEIVSDQPADIALHEKTFEILENQAVYDAKAKDLIGKVRAFHLTR